MTIRKKFLIIAVVILALAGGFYFYQHKSQSKTEFADANMSFVMEAYDKIQENYWEGTASSTVRAEVITKVAAELERATSSAAKKETALNIVASTLANLEPNGRNGLLTQKQEKEFRDVVNNKNPVTGEVEATVSKKIMGKTLYFKVKQIAPATLQEIGNALDSASSTPGLDSLIFDFRGNIGGSLDFLPAFLGAFIGQDQYAFDLYSKGEKNVIRTTLPKYESFLEFKEIAFLTDAVTQSTAELTVDTFRRYHLALIVGTTTKGWGTIENTYPIESQIDTDNKYLLLLVNALTVRSDNEPIEGRGIVPDIDATKSGWQNELPKYFRSTSLISAIREVMKRGV